MKHILQSFIILLAFSLWLYFIYFWKPEEKFIPFDIVVTGVIGGLCSIFWGIVDFKFMSRKERRRLGV